jgi:hypothetical protein
VQSDADYYKALKQLAREQRTTFSLQTSDMGRRKFRAIYKQLGVHIHLWPMPGLSGKPFNHLRGAYLNIDGDRHVMVDRTLPDDPYLFTLAHEMKHHLCDQGLAKAFCHDANQTETVEVGAEVFAAELLYPEGDFSRDLDARGVVKGACTQQDLVTLKHDVGTSLSYTGLRKRAINFGYAQRDIPNRGWKQIETSLYGVPYHIRRQSWS